MTIDIVQRAGPRRSQTVEIKDVAVSPASYYTSLHIPSGAPEYGFFQLTWTSLDAFNARAILQGSDDGIEWNDLGGAEGGIVLDTENDTQGWELTIITFRFLRLEYTPNNVSSGNLSWTFNGYA